MNATIELPLAFAPYILTMVVSVVWSSPLGFKYSTDEEIDVNAHKCQVFFLWIKGLHCWPLKLGIDRALCLLQERLLVHFKLILSLIYHRQICLPCPLLSLFLLLFGFHLPLAHQLHQPSLYLSRILACCWSITWSIQEHGLLLHPHNCLLILFIVNFLIHFLI